MNTLKLKELSNSDLYRRRQERPDSYGGNRFRTSEELQETRRLLTANKEANLSVRFSGLLDPSLGYSQAASGPLSMDVQGRMFPRVIPENGRPPAEVNGHHQVNEVEAEVPVSNSQRRHSDIKVYKEFCDFYARFNMANALANAICERCKGGFSPAEKIVNSNGELYHEPCFVCAQCFQQFPEGLFYEFEGRKYCEHDFQMLFAPCCHQCGEFIIGRVIKAMNNSWHPDCFCCDICQAILADVGFVKNAGRHLCRPCHNREKARGLGKYICQKCHAIIDEQPLIFKNDPYHPDHFSCTNCGKELTADARELKGELYCLPCHDKMGVPICGACRRPIEGRVVNAMGKQWHVEHFVCAKCEKPFLGHRHYERKGLAYCETHYNQLFGDVCYHCNRVIEGDGEIIINPYNHSILISRELSVYCCRLQRLPLLQMVRVKSFCEINLNLYVCPLVVSALNKAWCVNCFACSTCNTKLTLK
ncbi:LIM and senescent cell antigen-like-containing domain protein 1 [Arapaima gigas]